MLVHLVYIVLVEVSDLLLAALIWYSAAVQMPKVYSQPPCEPHFITNLTMPGPCIVLLFSSFVVAGDFVELTV